MNRNYLMIASVAIISLFLISGVVTLHTSAYTVVNSDSQKKISLSIQNGGIVNAGPQNWRMHGGNLVVASIAALPTVTSWSDLDYSLNASVNGLTSSGTFKLHMTGITSGGKSINLGIDAAVVSSIPAVCFPSYSVTGMCALHDTSEIPAFFIVAGYLHTSSSNTADAAKTSVTLMVEVAALNPWGQPIVISSMDPATGLPTTDVTIVATYFHARTFWEGVQVAGTLTGTIGKDATPVSGGF